jgi:cyclopropane fatty-acyl-phospholipid synthase-like methyltransferase
LPSDGELSALYARRDYFEGTDQVGYAGYAADAPQFARTFRGVVQRLLQYGPVNDLLEIGCGPGLFLAEARRVGIGTVVGVDRNPWAIEQLHAQGIEGHVGTIDALAANRRFDAIVMLDLLEHITEPQAFLAALRGHLRPAGRLFIMTPNIRSLLARVSGPRWVSFKIPEHVVYYSPRSIRRLLADAGFEVLSVNGAGQYVTVAFLLSRLQRLVPRLAAGLRAAATRLALLDRVVFVTNGSIDVVGRVRG